jgi:hypothetical protein
MVLDRRRRDAHHASLVSSSPGNRYAQRARRPIRQRGVSWFGDGAPRSKLFDLGDLEDFLGGIGVVVTLAYLAIETRQNTKEVRAASLDSVVASRMAFQRSVWGDASINKVWFNGMSGGRAAG